MTDPKQLIDAYIDDALDDAGFAALSAWLREDDANRREFTRALSLHSGIADWVNERSGGLLIPELAGEHEPAGDDEGLSWIEALSVLDDTQGEAQPVDLTEELNTRRQRRREADREKARHAASRGGGAGSDGPLPFSKAAVFLAFAAMLGLAFWLSPRFTAEDDPVAGPVAQGPVTPTPDDPEPAVAPVATVLATHEPVWLTPEPAQAAPTDDAAADALAGPRLTPGRYALASGAVELRLDRGAVMLVEGPAVFELADDHHGRLVSGRVSVDTTGSQRGFRLDTPTARAVSLGVGDRFGLAVDAGGRTRTHVYAGSMDFSSMSVAGPSASLRLSADQGAVVERSDARPRREPVAAEQFALEMAALSGKPVVTGDADYHNRLPSSVVMNRGPQSPRAWVALESTGRPLQRGTAWAQGYPSRPSTLIDTEGRVVDSYLVMFDPDDETGRFKTAEFELTFPGEVLTVITEDDGLAESHGWYGNGRVQYSDRTLDVDGLEGEPGENPQPDFRPDSIELSDDGRTMRVFLGAHNGADVFRVLVVRPARVGELPVGAPFNSFSHRFSCRGGVCPAYPDFGPFVGADPVRGRFAARSSLKGEI